ncbi:uncharacterized protein LOC115996110 [Ipomoea triloba]|uniref:uncharacterized protein LOC115996110 n=1 Tax=Ipomoea triloba TaxID=35885 RepID=UPI00125E30F7|nr:uncharacterized protein LOC115996110 [Ipomoea triloba]
MNGVETVDNGEEASNRCLQRVTYSEMLIGGQAGQEEEQDEVFDDKCPDAVEGTERCPVIKLSKEEKKALHRPLKLALIIKVLGRKVGYNYLLSRIKALWRPKSRMDLVALENEYFVVRFGSIDDYNYAKLGSPWMVMDHYLIVKEWVPNFDPLQDKTEKVLVWVWFPSLPMEYYNFSFLNKVGKEIGKPIKIDESTGLVSRGKFARMCVEVDITKPLLSKFSLKENVR